MAARRPLVIIAGRKKELPAGDAVAAAGVEVSGTVSDAQGNVRKLPVTVANATTTINAAHLNAIIEKSGTATVYYYLNAGLGAQGDAITFLNSGTAGSMFVSVGSGVSLIRNGASYGGEVKPGSMMTILRTATTNKWVC